MDCSTRTTVVGPSVNTAATAGPGPAPMPPDEPRPALAPICSRQSRASAAPVGSLPLITSDMAALTESLVDRTRECTMKRGIQN